MLTFGNGSGFIKVLSVDVRQDWWRYKCTKWFYMNTPFSSITKSERQEKWNVIESALKTHKPWIRRRLLFMTRISGKYCLSINSKWVILNSLTSCFYFYTRW